MSRKQTIMRCRGMQIETLERRNLLAFGLRSLLASNLTDVDRVASQSVPAEVALSVAAYSAPVSTNAAVFSSPVVIDIAESATSISSLAQTAPVAATFGNSPEEPINEDELVIETVADNISILSGEPKRLSLRTMFLAVGSPNTTYTLEIGGVSMGQVTTDATGSLSAELTPVAVPPLSSPVVSDVAGSKVSDVETQVSGDRNTNGLGISESSVSNFAAGDSGTFSEPRDSSLVDFDQNESNDNSIDDMFGDIGNSEDDSSDTLHVKDDHDDIIATIVNSESGLEINSSSHNSVSEFLSNLDDETSSHDAMNDYSDDSLNENATDTDGRPPASVSSISILSQTTTSSMVSFNDDSQPSEVESGDSSHDDDVVELGNEDHFSDGESELNDAQYDSIELNRDSSDDCTEDRDDFVVGVSGDSASVSLTNTNDRLSESVSSASGDSPSTASQDGSSDSSDHGILGYDDSQMHELESIDSSSNENDAESFDEGYAENDCDDSFDRNLDGSNENESHDDGERNVSEDYHDNDFVSVPAVTTSIVSPTENQDFDSGATSNSSVVPAMPVVTLQQNGEWSGRLIGSGYGKIEFERERGETEFEAEILGVAAYATYPVSVGGVVVGQIVTDGRGRGKLRFEIGDDHYRPFPTNFPTIADEVGVQIGDVLSGAFGQHSGYDVHHHDDDHDD
ncbi:hypothetical protein [Rubripirellula reticaptiva]|uniref:Uncharacterized protein n=1 Tax=Rubripirellula reticaptiva TaxID=2528013 RepID=A0A5C6EVB4_9BACT|nr:hypothetical protein [Rubripirellula reticaptiva]TWU51409.1 hypothetical protein Poly59_30010 [Rubripirellula reticaptiva]